MEVEPQVQARPIAYHMVALECLLRPELLSAEGNHFSAAAPTILDDVRSLVVATLNSLDERAAKVSIHLMNEPPPEDAQFAIGHYKHCFTYYMHFCPVNYEI
jgi:hypothetical protein